MVNTTPILGRLGVITIGGTAVGSAKDISANISAEIIKDYVNQSVLPAILESGNQSFKISFGKLFIDGTHASQVLAGATVEVIIYPKGTTPAGLPKFTITGVVLSTWQLKGDQKGIYGEDVSGEGATFTVGTT